MAQALPTTAVTLNDGSFSGTYWSPANGSPYSNPQITIAIPGVPQGWGLVGITSVLLDAGSNYSGGTAASINVQIIHSSGNINIGTGSVAATANNGAGGISYVGLRSAGLSYSRNDGAQLPLAGASIYYQLSPGGDATGIGPSTFGSGTSVQFNLLIAPIPRRASLIIT